MDNLPHFPFAQTRKMVKVKVFRNQHPFGILGAGQVELVEFGHYPFLPNYFK
jgi:hypothetical protein